MRQLAAIFACSIILLGLTFYFICFAEKLLSTDTLDNIWFYVICAGLSGLTYYASGRGDRVDYLLRGMAFFFLYMFILNLIDEFYEFETHTKWEYLPLGGLLICLMLTLLFRQAQKSRGVQ